MSHEMTSRFDALFITAVIVIMLPNRLFAQTTEKLPNRSTADNASPSIDGPDLEIFVDGLMAALMDEYDVAGATLAIVKDDKRLLTKGYGFAHMHPKADVTPGHRRRSDARTLEGCKIGLLTHRPRFYDPFRVDLVIGMAESVGSKRFNSTGSPASGSGTVGCEIAETSKRCNSKAQGRAAHPG